ncbi:alpha-protein kinase 1 isoform X2 [Lampris incognitus]|uniref:alpha-protein kinase 1 isoform X2 n=1 Tax=Lampris incognitus TaxID=2546036 RepID=UPI0024B5030A|nr:alpha-protein kinase 1 isoform X2 [Lampris incognitus]
MDSQEVGVWLEECLSAAQQPSQPSEAVKLVYCKSRDSLNAEVASLLQEALEMKWPFVPEKWQYKQSLSATEKTNLTDLISQHLPQLLALLKASILCREACWALAVVFLVDRFLYWMDESSQLLKITKLLHRRHPDTPVAPQLVIRQARVYMNSGKLQKAEYILSSLINNSGATGCWLYHTESDRALVQAVSIQVRGLVLQKLGLWLEAAQLIWVSLVGYYALPKPDKKGIGTSLGVLANILVSMNDEDYQAFRTNPDIDLSLLGDRSHRLLSAAEAAKMAVVYSQYTSLFVLTNVVTQGTCLLSYSFSKECPFSERDSFLLQAKESFEIGLLTKAEGELVTSQQELHTFLKAAYSLTITHKWLGTSSEVLTQAIQTCQKAQAHFYDYCHASNQDRDSLCADIMHLISQVVPLLQVKPFLNSDRGSFIPNSYRNLEERPISFTIHGFSQMIGRFQKYHASLCEVTETDCKRKIKKKDGVRLCITALGTTIGTVNTECATDNCNVPHNKVKGPKSPQGESNSSALYSPQNEALCTTLGSTDELGSSWQKFSFSGSGSPRPSSSSYKGSSGCVQELEENGCDQSCLTTQDSYGSDSEQFEVIEGDIETLGSEEDWVTDVVDGSPKPPGTTQVTHSVSQFKLTTSSSSLNASFNSQSSWVKISSDTHDPTNTQSQQHGRSKQGTSQSRKTPGSDECFSILETLDSEISDSAKDRKLPIADPAGGQFHTSPKPHLLESFDVDPNAETEVDSVPFGHKPAPKNPSTAAQTNLKQSVPEQCASTVTSTDSSFEMLEAKETGGSGTKISPAEKQTPPYKKNPSCYSCMKKSIVGNFSPDIQYLLTQQDYRALLSGVCHECLLKRLQSDKIKFKLKKYRLSHSALHLKFSRATGLWTARETCVYIGDSMNMNGAQRTALWVQFLHQEERLSSYVGKDYLKPKEIQFHLKDVERQMTAQYYVTEFNKRLYEKEVTAQIFFIPAEVLLMLEGDEIVGCITVEPHMLGDFVKLTNNTVKKDRRFQATDYGIAFGHFTYLFSNCQEVVVDLQGWVTANGKGLTYLTDPQIHSSKIPKGPSNFAERGLRFFLEEQHGAECNDICRWLRLPHIPPPREL